MPKNYFCAICQNTNQTTRLCKPCAKRPENAGWNQVEWLTTPDCDVVNDDNERIEDYATTTLEEKIVNMACMTIKMPYLNRRLLSHREIAFLLDCGNWWVTKIIKRYSDS